MATDNLGSASVGIEIDLKALQSQLNTAAKMIGTMTKDANKGGTTTGTDGGIFSGLISSARGAGTAIARIGEGGGSLGSMTAALGIMDASLVGVGASAGASGAMMATMGVALAGVLAVVAIAVVAFKALKAAVSASFDALAQAGDAQAASTTFEVLATNMGITTQASNEFAKSLEAMNYSSMQQTLIMSSLLRAGVGLTDTSLKAATAMRDMSVAAGVSSTEGIMLMGTAITRLNPQLLENFGINETATMMFDKYGATIGKTADSMSIAEKRQAMLNAIIAQGATMAGLANKADEDLNRGLTRLDMNFRSLQAGIGQVFLPLASGIVGIINDEITALTGTVDSNKDQFVAMGEAIRNYVLPMVQGFIDKVKAIPWKEVANNAYITGSVFAAIGQVAVLVGQTIWGAFRVIGLAIAIVIQVGRQLFNLFVALQSTVIGFFMALADPGNAGNYLKAVGDTWADFGSDLVATTGAIFDEMGSTLYDVGQPMADTIDGIMGSIQNSIDGFDINSFWSSLATGDSGADRPVKAVVDAAEEMSAGALKAVQKMAEELSKENDDFARAQLKAASDYETQLAELTSQHRDKMAQIKKDIATEQKSYDKAYAERTTSYRDELNKLANADNDRKKDINTQIAEELAKGRFADQTKLASLRSRLIYEEAINKESVAAAESAYAEDIANLKSSHSEKQAELQTQLDTEIAIKKKYEDDFAKYKDYIIADDITKLKESYKTRAAEDLRAHQERLASIVKNGAESAKAAQAAGQAEGGAYGAGVGGGIVDGLNKAKPEIRKAASEAGYELYDALTGKLIGMGYDRPLKYQKESNTWLPEFANGGIVGGKGGVDNNLAAVSRGEMILNNDQQRRMFELLNGTMAVPGGGKTNSGIVIQNMNITLPGVSNASDFSRELKLKLVTMRTT